MVNEEYPKLEPSKPRATSVNCCAASRVFLRERELIRECILDNFFFKKLVKRERKRHSPCHSFDEFGLSIRSCFARYKVVLK